MEHPNRYIPVPPVHRRESVMPGATFKYRQLEIHDIQGVRPMIYKLSRNNGQLSVKRAKYWIVWECYNTKTGVTFCIFDEPATSLWCKIPESRRPGFVYAATPSTARPELLTPKPKHLDQYMCSVALRASQEPGAVNIRPRHVDPNFGANVVKPGGRYTYILVERYKIKAYREDLGFFDRWRAGDTSTVSNHATIYRLRKDGTMFEKRAYHWGIWAVFDKTDYSIKFMFDEPISSHKLKVPESRRPGFVFMREDHEVVAHAIKTPIPDDIPDENLSFALWNKRDMDRYKVEIQQIPDITDWTEDDFKKWRAENPHIILNSDH